MTSNNHVRLVVALSVAALLAVFLLYTSVAGNATPSLSPSQLPGHTGVVTLAGSSSAPRAATRTTRRCASACATSPGAARRSRSATAARFRISSRWGGTCSCGDGCAARRSLRSRTRW